MTNITCSLCSANSLYRRVPVYGNGSQRNTKTQPCNSQWAASSPPGSLYVFRCSGFSTWEKWKNWHKWPNWFKIMAAIYSTREIEHKCFAKKQGADYLSFLIDCQCWASRNSLFRRQIGPFTAYHEVNNIFRWMVVIILREGDLLNPLPFSIIGCCFYAVLLYAANIIRRVIKAL